MESTRTASHSDQDNPPGSVAEAVQAAVRLLRMLRYRKSIVLAAVILCAFLGMLYASTATPLYEARASLLVIPTGADMWSPSTALDGARQALIPTYERLFYEDVVLQSAARQLQSDASMRKVFSGTPHKKWAAVLRANLSASRVRHTNLIEISYEAISARAAETIVAAIIQSYLMFMDSNHRDASTEIVRVLETERAQIEARLNVRQADLVRLKRSTGDLGLSDASQNVHPSVQRVLRLNETLIQVQQKRLELQSTQVAVQQAIARRGQLQPLLVQLEPIVGRELLLNSLGLSPQQLEMRGTVEQQLMEHRARLDKLSQHYGPAHPEVVELQRVIEQQQAMLAQNGPTLQQRLQELNDQALGPILLAMIDQRLNQMVNHERALQQEYAQAEKVALALNDRMTESSIVENDVERLRHLHDTLLDRMTGIDINQNQADVRVTVVTDPVAKNRPVSPRLALIALICLIAGVSSGTGVAYVMDLLDDRFQSPDEMHLQLDLPLLAAIGELENESDSSGLDALCPQARTDSPQSEAFRTLRTALRFCDHDTTCLAITSTEPGDGKTTLMASLGMTCAAAGKRTLLIDADLRRPGLSRLLELRGVAGLTHLLHDPEPVPELAAKTVCSGVRPNLDVIACGPRTSDPAELLSGQRFAELLAWADGRYDQVLVDCPPVMAASDAAIIGRQTDAMALIVQPGKNHRRLVLRAVQSLRSLHVPVVGTVANRVQSHESGDYYGLNYGAQEYAEPDIESGMDASSDHGMRHDNASRYRETEVRRAA